MTLSVIKHSNLRAYGSHSYSNYPISHCHGAVLAAMGSIVSEHCKALTAQPLLYPQNLPVFSSNPAMQTWGVWEL